jgi:ABC-type branched-subunit amino acid transport system substrate-binding protein
MKALRLGACLSLTGRYGRFGRQAANGLLAWQRLAGEPVELVVEDDGSDPATFAAAFPRVANRVDLLLGPYSTELMRLAAEFVSDLDALVWNQGGAGDDVQALSPGHVVSVLAPTSRYAVPFVDALAEGRPELELWVVRGHGKFGRQVAAGAIDAAHEHGLATREVSPYDGGGFDGGPDGWALFSAGRFEDDVAIVKAALAADRPPEVIGSVAAGVRDFASEVDDAEGIYGIAQWFPGRDHDAEVGPSESAFLAAYGRLADSIPDYPAVQAAAGATLAVHCAQLAGGVSREALWDVATGLETSTMVGGFKVAPDTGSQVEQTPVLLRWHSGSLALSD